MYMYINQIYVQTEYRYVMPASSFPPNIEAKVMASCLLSHMFITHHASDIKQVCSILCM